MVAEDMNTASLGNVSATPPVPNKIVSVCTALTTTLTTMSAPAAASAGLFAPLPPSATNRDTASSATSQPVTTRPARRSEVAMPKPIEPSPITATFVADEDIRLFPRASLATADCLGSPSRYHGLAALPKRETRRKRIIAKDRYHGGKRIARSYLPVRPLAVRARADAGLLRQHQRATR